MLSISFADEFSVREFRDASDLLSTLQKENFSAVVADIMLPGLDGYGFIRAIRSDPHLKNLCVIAVSALAMAGDLEKGMASGFNRYLVKPIPPEEIAQVIKDCLQVNVPGDSVA